jgi:hypothetical protein
MEIIDLKDIAMIADKFSRAMYNDPLHEYFFPDSATRQKKIYSMYYFMVKMNYLKAHRTSEACEGIILWEKPFEHGLKVSTKDFIIGSTLFIKVGLSSLSKMVKYQKWSERLKKKSISDPFWYLSVVIVDPAYQGKGYASSLIRPILAIADESDHRVYLETQNVDNVPIYEKYGFRTVSAQIIPGTNIMHFIMIRS